MKRKYLRIEDLEFRLDKRKNYKNIRLKVLPPKGDLVVTSPEYISDRMIKGLVRQNIGPIRDEIKKQRSTYQDYIESYKNGEILKVFGKDYRLDIKKGKKNTGRIENGKIRLSLKDPDDEKLAEKQVDKILRELLRNKAEFFLKTYLKKMDLKISGFSIRKMKTRRGTCNITDSFIWLSYDLVRHPYPCLEYVIVHELSHLVVKDHSKDFYKLVLKYYPDYKKVEAYLDKELMATS